MSIMIEKATPADAENILAYLRRVGGETENLSFGSEGLSFSVESEEAFLFQMESSRDEVMLVAKENGEIIGNASLSRLPRRMGHRGEVSVTILKAFWGKGIGSALLAEIIAFAKENSFDVIDLQVRSDNRRAIRLYEKFGFKKFGTHPAFFKIAGETVSFDYMYLNLK
ncbi:MAG: GNAT family N-acetyltransferase [Clostridia bacterium]|nr:GNAT family N-acetyltransferase [Clostridia bacterium]